jgi:hypothetical protein
MSEQITPTEQVAGRKVFSLAGAALLFICAAALFGWFGSFIGLHGYAVQKMAGFTNRTGWAVPGTYDGAALACTFAVYRASINGRSALRGRVLMFGFTAISSAINWTHQVNHSSRLVAAGLPIAAVLVFDFLMTELRADWEAAHGRKAFRLRPALLLLRYVADREGTRAAFREQITSIPVSALAGLGAELSNSAKTAASVREVESVPEPELADSDKPLSDDDLLLMAEPPTLSSMGLQAAVEHVDGILPGDERSAADLAALLNRRGVRVHGHEVNAAGVAQARRRARQRAIDANENIIQMPHQSAHSA